MTPLLKAGPGQTWMRRGFGLWVLIWMFWLYEPAVDVFTGDYATIERVALGVGLIGFMAGYVGAFLWLRLTDRLGPNRLDRPVTARRRRAAIAVSLTMSAIAFASGGFVGKPWLGLTIYAAIASCFMLPEKLLPPVLAVHLAFVIGLGIHWHEEWQTLIVFALVILLAGVGAMSGRRNVSLSRELVDMKEELTRAAVTEERLRFAREVHDLVGHNLSLITLKAELAKRLVRADPDRAEVEIGDIEQTSRDALAEVREAVAGYRQMTLSEALAGARSTLVAASIHCVAPVRIPPLPDDVENALAWVVREATTNVLRHSAARVVRIELATNDGSVRLTIADDGTGVRASTTAGHGLTGLAERLADLGGRLRWGRGPDGFRLTAELPLTFVTPTVENQSSKTQDPRPYGDSPAANTVEA